MSKFCTHCGNELKPGAKFCTSCGQKVNEPPIQGGTSFSNGSSYSGGNTGQSLFLNLGDGLHRLFHDKNADKMAIVKELFLKFDGRLNRQAYLYRYALLWVITTVMLAVLGGAFDDYDPSILEYALTALSLVALLFSAIATWALSVRRLHDLDKSGWWLLLFAIPLLNLWVSILIVFIKGTNGPNRYGEDPLQ